MPYSKSTIYAMVANGLFPVPHRLGARAVGWLVRGRLVVRSPRGSRACGARRATSYRAGKEWSMTAAALAEHLHARPVGRGKWVARCPAHDDRCA
ncbi:AlpA family phage regulatory protein [Edaphobacter modestus]|uniref:helix-turn-helix transcriptional regulator n=1 Tax=Edaphobacter modestus TaxID=388466 RepID=UPI001A928FBA